jgi:DNA-damage-inducible protein D
MSQIPHTSPFDGIRHLRLDGKEYWSARELYKLLGYSTWQKFQNAIEQAKVACENSGQDPSDHFNLKVKIVKAGVTTKPREDYRLSRCACYLIVQNADPNKPIVALGQTYFAYQTRRQEINDELALANLPEDQKRLIFRSLMSTYNVRLAEAAKQASVIEPGYFATFQDHGYMLHILLGPNLHVLEEPLQSFFPIRNPLARLCSSNVPGSRHAHEFNRNFTHHL